MLDELVKYKSQYNLRVTVTVGNRSKDLRIKHLLNIGTHTCTYMCMCSCRESTVSETHPFSLWRSNVASPSISFG